LHLGQWDEEKEEREQEKKQKKLAQAEVLKKQKKLENGMKVHISARACVCALCIPNTTELAAKLLFSFDPSSGHGQHGAKAGRVHCSTCAKGNR